MPLKQNPASSWLLQCYTEPFGRVSTIYQVAYRRFWKPSKVCMNLKWHFGGGIGCRCWSLGENLGVIVLYMLFVDSCLHFLFSMQSRVWKCVFGSALSTWLKKRNKWADINYADCTQYLYINMCMIHASFENISCLFSLLNKLTTCYNNFALQFNIL